MANRDFIWALGFGALKAWLDFVIHWRKHAFGIECLTRAFVLEGINLQAIGITLFYHNPAFWRLGLGDVGLGAIEGLEDKCLAFGALSSVILERVAENHAILL